MSDKIISIVGSWRPMEHENNPGARQRFVELSKALGSQAYMDECTLRVVWSNDHLVRQCTPLMDENRLRLNELPDGRFSAKPSDVRYLFEDTADYLSLVGYLEAFENNPREHAKIELRISDQMWTGTGDVRTVSWPSVSTREIAERSLQSFVNEGIISIVHIVGGNELLYLRSLQLRDLIKGKSPADAVVALGGGRATEKLCHDAAPLGKLIPLPYCGSAGLKALKECYAQNTEHTCGRLKPIFGPSLIKDEKYSSMSVREAVHQFDGALGNFLGHPSARGYQPLFPTQSLC